LTGLTSRFKRTLYGLHNEPRSGGRLNVHSLWQSLHPSISGTFQNLYDGGV
jgi:hypothetical protein